MYDTCTARYGYFGQVMTTWRRAEKAEPSETPWHTYDGTPTTARMTHDSESQRWRPRRSSRDYAWLMYYDCLAHVLRGPQRKVVCHGSPIGAQDCTPEIKTSEIIAKLQWQFPTSFHVSVAFSKGLSLFRRIFTGTVQLIFSGIFQRRFTFVSSGV